MTDLSSYRGKKNVVLYFYPKDGTPACTIQAIGFSDRENEFQKLDTIVFGVSRDDVLSHQAFRDMHGLTVELLADTEQEVCRLYDVIQDKIVDGHAKSFTPGTLDASKDLTGCNLIHRYPVLTGQANDMCEKSTAGCANTSDVNICNHFQYP